jgi:uncharacterized protein (DUF58 family)
MKAFELFQEAARRAARPLRSIGSMFADAWPLTPLGMAVGVVAVVALAAFGFEKLDLVLLVVGYGAGGLLVIALGAVLVGAVGIRLWLRRAEFPWRVSSFETGSPVETGFYLPSLWWFPLVQARWSWLSPAGASTEQFVEAGRSKEHAELSRRGLVRGVTRRIVVQDAFGLAKVAFRHRQPGPFEVLPHLGGIRRLPVLTSLTGGEEIPHPMGLEDGDRVELRRYVPGDSARYIHWKVFGRTRRLMVRVPERALSRARRTVAYLVAGPRDEAAAAAARAAIDEGVLGIDWQFGADGAPEPTDDAGEALHKVLSSASYRGRSGAGLERFLAAVDPRGPAALVVFAPPNEGPWIDELRRASARRSGRIRVVLAVDAVRDGSPAAPWWEWLLTPKAEQGTPRAQLENVGRALSQLRCEVVVIDRVSGRILGDGVRLRVSREQAA